MISFGGEPEEPWALLDSFPGDVDVVAVMENPAQQLLSDEGRASRKFIGSMGMFGKSRHAWEALGGLFGTDADGVMGKLLSGRVVVLIDSLYESSQNPLSMIKSVDTNWVVMAEVDGDSFKALRKKLKPVPREIVYGVAVYGIEQGRYALVMLKGKDGGKSRVMLSPKGGRGLLERGLGVVLESDFDDRGDVPVPIWEHENEWGLAVRIRVDGWVGDRLIAGNGEAGAGSSREGTHHVRALIGDGESGTEILLAMPFTGENASGRAPVGMLSGLDERAVVAMAASPVMQLAFDEANGLTIALRGGEPLKGTVLEPAGSLFVLSGDDVSNMSANGPMGLTVLSLFEKGEVDAGSMDALIEPLVSGGGGGARFPGGVTGERRLYGGRFPGAIRSHAVVDEYGIETRVAWKATGRSGSSDLIFSFSDAELAEDIGDRVRMLDDVAASMDAVGGGMIASPVVMSGFIRVRELFESFPGMPWVEQESMLGGLEHVSWEIVHDETALRGTVLIEKGRE